jgi:hypothetical protein
MTTDQAVARQAAHENLNRDLVAALELFVAQWNACGPNSDFGRYFQNVRDAAVSALAKVQR